MKTKIKGKFINQVTVIFLVIIFFIVGCSTTNGDIKKSTENINEHATSKIKILFNEYNVNEAIIPENIIKFDTNSIYKMYWKKDFGSYEIAVCLDEKDTLNLLYINDETCYSICQQSNWTNGDTYVYEDTDVDNFISEFKNILGSTVVEVIVPVGSACSFIFYIRVNNKEASLLLSDSISGGFSKFDIDKDGQKELLCFDEYMYIKINNKLYKAIYDYDKDSIKQVLFNENKKCFTVYFSDGTNKIYFYDTKQQCLVNK